MLNRIKLWLGIETPCKHPIKYQVAYSYTGATEVLFKQCLICKKIYRIERKIVRSEKV